MPKSFGLLRVHLTMFDNLFCCQFMCVCVCVCDLALGVQGSAGQSFGCFMVSGMKTRVVGEANDYVGKGMAGGDISILPPADSAFDPQDASLVGNTCLYGATGGRLFVNGKAGKSPAAGCASCVKMCIMYWDVHDVLGCA